MTSTPRRNTKGLIAVVGEFLFELPQCALRAGVEAGDDAAGLVLDQAARREGDQEFPGAGLGSVDRVLALEGEDGLLDLMREQPAIVRENRLLKEISAVHGGCPLVLRSRGDEEARRTPFIRSVQS